METGGWKRLSNGLFNPELEVRGDIADISPQANAWIGVGVTSIALEVVLLAFPIFLVWELQMPLASKLTVVLGFAFRIP